MQFIYWVLSCFQSKPLSFADQAMSLSEELTTAEILLSLCDSVGLTRTPMERLLAYQRDHVNGPEPRYWAISDFTIHSKNKRLHVFDTVARTVKKYYVAHGKGSDPKFEGFCKKFSNVPNSLCSSYGIYRCSEPYASVKFGKAMRLDGMEESNSKARSRAIVFHGAVYAEDAYVVTMGKTGRSEGCQAVGFQYSSDLIDKLKNGSLLYVWNGEVSPAKTISMTGEFVADWDSEPMAKSWTKMLSDALDKYGQKILAVPLLKDDHLYFRKDWGEMSLLEKKQALIALISSMARFESGFSPVETYKEGFNDSKGDAVISRGLLQISKESVNQRAYGGNIKNAYELHDAKTNLECGVKILNYQVPRDKYIGSGSGKDSRGGARYWSALRDSSRSQDKIQAKTRAII